MRISGEPGTKGKAMPDDPEKINSPPLVHDDVNIKIYEVFRDYIKHEDNLINNRLTWILTIHGFLYATYGLTMQKKMEIAQKIASDLTTPAAPRSYNDYSQIAGLCHTLWLSDRFLICISIIGLVISICGSTSIIAAVFASGRITTIFQDLYPLKTSKQDAEEVGRGWRQRLSYRIRQWVSIKEWRRRTTKVIDINKGGTSEVKLPTIVGGGNIIALRTGMIAPLLIPAVLLSSWLTLFILQHREGYITQSSCIARPTELWDY